MSLRGRRRPEAYEVTIARAARDVETVTVRACSWQQACTQAQLYVAANLYARTIRAGGALYRVDFDIAARRGTLVRIDEEEAGP